MTTTHPNIRTSLHVGLPSADDLWAAKAFFRYAHGIDPDD